MRAFRPASLAPLPVAAAWVGAPVALLAARLSGGEGTLALLGPQGLGLWVALCALALLACLIRSAKARTQAGGSSRPQLAVALLLAAATWALAQFLDQQAPLLGDFSALFDELHLPALLFFCGLWVWNFGAPERSALAQAGAALGAMVVLDFLLTAIMARSLVLGGGYLFGEGAALADAFACLLCVSLCATLGETPEPGVPRLARWLILAGLLAGFSRPGLIAAGLICLALERGPLRPRMVAAGLCALALWLSVTLPLPRMAAGDDLGLAWHLGAVSEAMSQEPEALWRGLPLDSPMALAMPEFQGLIWDAESEGLPVGVSDIPSSALRLFAAWGAGAPLALAAAAIFCALRGRSRFGLGLAAALAVCAALSPALHVPASAVGLGLGFLAAARRVPEHKDQ